MNFSSFRAISLSFASFLATAVCATAQLLPEKEEDIPVEFIPRLENTVSIGFYKMKTGPKVRFGNLGMIPQPLTTSSDESDTVGRVYSNGSVAKDSLGTYEQDLSGKALVAGADWFSTPDWKSQLGSDGVVTVYTRIMYAQTNDDDGMPMTNPDGLYIPVTVPGDTPGTDQPDTIFALTSKFLGYNANHARSWQVQNASQITRNNSDPTGVYRVAMSAYGVTSAGVSVEADSSGSSGFELSLEHKLGQRGRFEWGIAGGLKLVGINAKASAVIPAYLTATTDVYKTVPNSLNLGAMPNISQPTGDGKILYFENFDQSGIVFQYTTALAKPLDHSDTGDISGLTPLDVNPANVNWGTSGLDTDGRIVMIQGNWQLKGAYYLARLGPTFRYRFNDTFAVSGTVGLAQGWIGTTFKAEEAFDDYFDVYASDGKTEAPLSSAVAAQVFRSKEENVTRKFVSGIYGELNVEYWMTERTGFYLGVSQQTMREYSQKPLSGRTAKIDLGSTSGWKIGVMTRF